ncbi:hypothetical protein M422DRAFT_273044 [Sphaerobolus stellatus SS14]|uniref:DUF6533 domain-containing protein n=1 Tax=Sphaerobolus stellatus (strain SS14) TaxID=990650 RepID=A0A0C9TA87_SPHS4|nr:hypothetical protein M422DRAFT_273044 [Sphaerobolus stellatus SS14]
MGNLDFNYPLYWINTTSGVTDLENFESVHIKDFNVLLHLQIYQYYTCVGLTVLLWNSLCTFEKERNYVWKQPKTLTIIAYLILRYFPLFAFIIGFNFRYFVSAETEFFDFVDVHVIVVLEVPYNDCGLALFRTSVGPIVTATSGVILILRSVALYNGNGSIKALLIVFYLVQLVSTILSTFKDSRQNNFPNAFDKTQSQDMCAPINEETHAANSPQWLLPLCVSALLFDITVFSLTFWKGIQARKRGANSTLMNVLVQGGNIYFLTLFLVNLSNVFLILFNAASSLFETSSSAISTIFPFAGEYFGNVNIQLTAVITSVIVSNLFLNIREAAYQSRIVHSNPSAITHTAGQWALALPGSELAYFSNAHENMTSTQTFHQQFIGQRALQVMMGYEDFEVVLGNEDKMELDTELRSLSGEH